VSQQCLLGLEYCAEARTGVCGHEGAPMGGLMLDANLE